MPVKTILQLGDPILLEKSEKVKDVSENDVKATVLDLKDTIKDFKAKNGFGRGIAAPQIGILKRIIYVNMNDGTFSGALINPEIIWADDRHRELWDNCFSFPELLVRVSRANQITVKYLNEDDAPRSIDANGDLAELLQHEIDHLDGILAVQRAVSPEAFMTRTEWEKQGRPI